MSSGIALAILILFIIELIAIFAIIFLKNEKARIEKFVPNITPEVNTLTSHYFDPRTQKIPKPFLKQEPSVGDIGEYLDPRNFHSITSLDFNKKEE